MYIESIHERKCEHVALKKLIPVNLGTVVINLKIRYRLGVECPMVYDMSDIFPDNKILFVCGYLITLFGH